MSSFLIFVEMLNARYTGQNPRMLVVINPKARIPIMIFIMAANEIEMIRIRKIIPRIILKSLSIAPIFNFKFNFILISLFNLIVISEFFKLLKLYFNNFFFIFSSKFYFKTF
jgi:hypothetical protein